MDIGMLVDEVDEMIARLEYMTGEHKGLGGLPPRIRGVSREVLRARKARLNWLRRVREGLLAERPEAAPLH